MTIPDYQSLMRPVLELLDEQETWLFRDVRSTMADRLELTVAEREKRLPSGRQTAFSNRVGWALTYLVQAGLAERPRRGSAQITTTGRSALQELPDRIDTSTLERYPAFRAFRERSRTTTTGDAPAADPANSREAAEATPHELIEGAVRQSRAALEAEVLARALELSPTGFEDLVMALLESMGYGRLGTVQRTSTTGDAGVDGIISQDPLGLDRIYVQAKRYAVNQPVARPRIHEFAGALLGKQGDRGVFITTSRFTSGAEQEAERVNARIELIDGVRLASLLVHYGVGVQVQSTFELYRLDEDFLDSIG